MNTARQIELQDLASHVAARGASGRSLTAIAGAPGSGKSTLADALAQTLNAAAPGSAAVLAMDGFHYDDAVLEARGWRTRKGAPHTFDMGGLAHMLGRLKADDADEVAVPVFDREIEIARNAARIIPHAVRQVIVEGNYLLLDRAPWASLRRYFDTCVFLDVPREVLRARLARRWVGLGYEAEEIDRRLSENDLPNVDLVIAEGARADFVVVNH
ncbi:MAG: nucleoside/nucleotide kinase family protein [Marinibacterium sp.]